MFFISSLDISNGRPEKHGVTKKILLQIKTFQKLGFTVDFIFLKDNKCFIYRNGGKEYLCDTTQRYLYNIEKISPILTKLIDATEYYTYYLRFEGLSPNLYRFLSNAKSRNKELIINAELPTFQKRWEPGTKIKGKLNFIARRIVDNILSSPIDHMITFDDQNKIFHRPTIQIENFADVSRIPIKKIKHDENDIHLVGVAQMTPSHGFDRVISGLYKYYSQPNHTRNVYFHIIGDGAVKSQWQAMVRKFKLDKYVLFEGIKTSDELTDYIDRAQLAIGSLAFFRKKASKASELKIREYCARGIPFIYSAYEPMLNDKEWCLKIIHDEQPVDINKVIDFIDQIDYMKTIPEIRKFAEESCTPESQLNKIYTP